MATTDSMSPLVTTSLMKPFFYTEIFLSSQNYFRPDELVITENCLTETHKLNNIIEEFKIRD